MQTQPSIRFELRVKKLLNEFSGIVRFTYDGGELVKGYKPDRVYLIDGCTWILELESSTSRKGFIGGYVKAQKYFHDRQVDGRLLFIINKDKRNLSAVAKHIQIYHDWLKDCGIQVMPAYFINDDSLQNILEHGVTFLSTEFLNAVDAIVN